MTECEQGIRADAAPSPVPVGIRQRLTTTALQCSETGAPAASEPHQHQAHRRAWVSPPRLSPRLYLRTRPPSYLGDHLQPLPGSSCCSTGKQGSWPVPLATFHRGSQQSVGRPRGGLAAWPSTLIGCDASFQLLTAHPCHPCPCWEQEHGADSKPQTPSYTRWGCPEKGMPCVRSHDNQISELGPSSFQPWSVLLTLPSPQTARMGGAWEAHHPQADTPPPLRPTRVCKYLFFYHVRIFFFLTPDNAKMVFKAHTKHPG